MRTIGSAGEPSGRWDGGVLAAGLFLTQNLTVLLWAPVHRVDPLALCFTLGGLALATGGRATLAALPFALAVLTKVLTPDVYPRLQAMGDRLTSGSQEVVEEFGLPGYAINVGPITNSTGIAIGHGAQSSVTQGVSGADLATLFAGIYRKIDDRPDDPNVDKEDVKYKVGRIEQEVQKQDSASEPKLQGWLGELAGMAPDIFDVTVASLAGPTAAVSMIIKKVADKAKQIAGRG